jgi:hypothetical protein
MDSIERSPTFRAKSPVLFGKREREITLEFETPL